MTFKISKEDDDRFHEGDRDGLSILERAKTIDENRKPRISLYVCVFTGSDSTEHLTVIQNGCKDESEYLKVIQVMKNAMLSTSFGVHEINQELIPQ